MKKPRRRMLVTLTLRWLMQINRLRTTKTENSLGKKHKLLRLKNFRNLKQIQILNNNLSLTTKSIK